MDSHRVSVWTKIAEDHRNPGDRFSRFFLVVGGCFFGGLWVFFLVVFCSLVGFQ